MFESIDESTFHVSELTPSASPVRDTLHDALHDTVQDTASKCSDTKSYLIEQVMTACSIARRTAFKYASEVVQVWYWLPEYEIRVNGIYSEFALSELKRRKALGNLENYRSVVHGENEGAIAQFKASQFPQQQATEQPVEGELLDGLDAGVLARYQTKPQTNLPTTQQYFNTEDYQSRYSGASSQLAKQQASEINFANELLSQFADFTEDSEAWEKAEAEKKQARERKAATEGMSQALTEFMQKNTAYRAMLDKLESGQVTPQQVADFLARMQKQNPESA